MGGDRLRMCAGNIEHELGIYFSDSAFLILPIGHENSNPTSLYCSLSASSLSMKKAGNSSEKFIQYHLRI